MAFSSGDQAEGKLMQSSSESHCGNQLLAPRAPHLTLPIEACGEKIANARGRRHQIQRTGSVLAVDIASWTRVAPPLVELTSDEAASLLIELDRAGFRPA
jgi:hypothetical protein